MPCPGIISVVDGIGGVESIFVRECAIHLHDSEVFPNRIRSCVIGVRSTSTNVGTVGLRPQSKVRHNRGIKVGHGPVDSVSVRQHPLPRLRIGNNGDFGQIPLLTETFVVSKYECLVLLYGPTRRATELVSSERRDARICRPNLAVKEVPRIEGAVAQELVPGAVECIRAGLRHDSDLPTGPVAELGRVHIGNDVEFPHRFNAQQLSAHASGSRADRVASAGILHAVPQENVFAGTPAGNREVVSRPGAAGGVLLDRA